MKTKHLTATLAAAATALTLAVPAQGAALPVPSDDVAPGKIEHTVQIQQVSGSNAVPSHVRIESWLGRDRSRSTVTDLRTGTLRAETVATRTEIRTYNAHDNIIRVERRKKPGGLPETSFAFEAAVQKHYVENGYTRVIGETTVNGRRALVTESVEGVWKADAPGSRTTAVVDAETYQLYVRTTEHAKGDFKQVDTYTSELLDAATANAGLLTMRKHRGAKVRTKTVRARAATAGQQAPTPGPDDPSYTVPAGLIEHTVTERKVEGSRAVPSHERTERWLTRTGARVVVRNLATGKVRAEITATAHETRIFDAEKNTVTVNRTKKAQRLPYGAAAFDAKIHRAYVEHGIMRVAGERTVRGRRALVLESVPAMWHSSEPQSQTTSVVDAETYELYERTTGLPDGQFGQTEIRQVTELLPVTARTAKARLAMSRHRGAKVRTR